MAAHHEEEVELPLLASGAGGRTSEDESRPELPSLGSLVVGRSGLLAGIANMSNSIIGAGIIGLPFAVAQAGFFTGVVLLVTLCAVTDWTIRLIVIDAKLSSEKTYIGIMRHCFGEPGRVAVSLFQFLFACGGMVACCVIIGDTIPSVLRAILPGSWTSVPWVHWLTERNVVTPLVIGSIAYPLSLYRDISKLAHASAFALLSMFVIVGSVVLKGPTVDASLRGSRDHVYTIVTSKVFESIGVISFAYVCHHNSLLIYGSLKTPTLDRFDMVTHASTLMSLLCCLLISVSGYLVFTDKTQANILNNFPQDDFVINIARLCFGLNMFTTLPLEVFVCREVIETLLDKPFSYLRHWTVTTVLVASTLIVSMTTCDLGLVLALTGGLSATALAFLFPAACYYTLLSGPWFSIQKLCASACAAFGIIVMIMNTLFALGNFFSNDAPPKQC